MNYLNKTPRQLFREVQLNDLNTFLNVDEVGQLVRINGVEIPIVYTTDEVFELKQANLDLPQSNNITFFCKKQDLNIKDLSKINLNREIFNIDGVKEVGELLMINLTKIQ